MGSLSIGACGLVLVTGLAGLAAIRCNKARGGKALIAIVNGPSDVTKKPVVFDQDPDSAVIAVVDRGAQFKVLEIVQSSKGSAVRYARVKLSDGQEGFLKEGHASRANEYSFTFPGGRRMTGRRQTDVELIEDSESGQPGK